MLVHCRVPNSTNRVSDASAALGLGMDPIDFNCKPPSAPQQFVSKVSLQGSHEKDINQQVLTKEFDVQMLDIPIEIKVGYFPIGFVPPQKWSFDLSCVRKLFICVHFFCLFSCLKSSHGPVGCERYPPAYSSGAALGPQSSPR